jgi:hypothetical protein
MAHTALVELEMKHRQPPSARLSGACLIVAFALMPVAAQAAPAQDLAAHPPIPAPLSEREVHLTPHRAVYNLSLGETGAGSNVTDIRGRLIYDFQGSACQGYTLNTRLLTEVFDRDSKASISDIHTESWEDASGDNFRFSTSQYADGKLAESSKGTARRIGHHGDSIAIRLEKPQRASFTITGKIMFPTQHSAALLKAAMGGQARLHAGIYDGSEKGAKVYETTSVLGAALELSANSALPPVKNSERLDGVQSWPVVVSYYDAGPRKDGLPSYEISFRMFANGISRKLKLDYGTFSLDGELLSIDFYPEKACQ